MKEHLNASTFFVSVAMYAAEISGLLLVVEGPDDQLALKKHSLDGLKLLPGTGGREHILRAAERAELDRIENVKFLVDRDYDGFIEASSRYPSNVVVSVSHDLFTDILNCDAELLEHMIAVHLSTFGRRPGGGLHDSSAGEIKRRALKLASRIAAIRIVNARRGLGLNFKRLPIGTLEPGEYSLEGLVAALLRRNSHPGNIKGQVAHEAEQILCEWESREMELVGDHDLIDAVAHELNQVKSSPGRRALQKEIIIAVSCKSLARNAWFIELQEWCSERGVPAFDCDLSAAA